MTELCVAGKRHLQRQAIGHKLWLATTFNLSIWTLYGKHFSVAVESIFNASSSLCSHSFKTSCSRKLWFQYHSKALINIVPATTVVISYVQLLTKLNEGWNYKK